MKFLCLTILLYFSAGATLYSQEYIVKQAKPVTEPVYFDFQPVGEGTLIATQAITAVYQDDFGILWIGTDGAGLFRYDGYRYKRFFPQADNPYALSITRIQYLSEDRQNRLWVTGFGSIDYRVRSAGRFYKLNPLPDSLKNLVENHSRKVVEDAQGHLWCGTSFGAIRIRFPENAENKPVYDRFLPDEHDISSAKNDIISLEITSNGRVWLGTTGGLGYIKSGTAELHPQTSSYHFLTDETDLSKADDIHPFIHDIKEDNSGNLWASTSFSLLKIIPEPAGKKLINYRFDEAAKRWEFGSASVNKGLLEIRIFDKPLLWCNTYNNGARLFYPDSEMTQPYLVDNNRPPGRLMSQSGNSIYQEDNGSIWFGTGAGLYYYNARRSKFHQYHRSLGKLATGSEKNLRFVFNDTHGNLWIAQESLYRCNRNTGEIYQSFFLPQETWYYQNKILEDKSGNIWLASEYGGVYRWEAFSKKMKKIPERGPFGFIGGNNTALAVGARNHIWVARHMHNDQTNSFQFKLLEYDGDSGKYLKAYPVHALNDLGTGYIYDITESLPGKFWLGTSLGLVNFQQKNGASKLYKSTLSASNAAAGMGELNAADLSISSVCADPLQPDRYLWLGTRGVGLSRFDIRNASFQAIPGYESLQNTIVNAVLTDDKGDLWLGTDRGMLHVLLDQKDRNVKQVIRYSDENGLISKDFTYFYGHNAYKTTSGEMIFTAPTGFHIFDPDKITHDTLSVYVDSLSINHKPVIAGLENTPLDSMVYLKKTIRLPYHQNTLTLRMTATEGRSTVKSNQYRYRMDGIDGEWVDNGSRRIVQYTALAPGDYQFRAKAANAAGIWSETELQLRIIISPPWWRTNLAYFIYFLLIAGSITGFIHYRERSLRLRAAMLEKTVHERTETIRKQAEDLKEMDSLKSRFFANISHEFRTPLTLILGQIENVMEKQRDADDRKKLGMAFRNGARLQQLINQLLDLSKLESKQMRLRARPVELIAFSKGMFYAFESLAEMENMKMVFSVTPADSADREIYIDPEKMEKALFNLLSNAFKFTQEGGAITMRINLPERSDRNSSGAENDDGENVVAENQFVEIRIEDTGSGVPLEKQPYVFDRFYQADDSNTRVQEGTGIGLALVKEFVELHHGKISLESGEGEGAVFIIHLPLGMSHFKPEEIVERPRSEARGAKREKDRGANSKKRGTQKEPLTIDRKPSTIHHRPSSSAQANQKVNKSTELVPDRRDQQIILVVEDNPDVRSFVCDQLKANYDVIEAANGLEGIAKAEETMPDIILTDVMMPKMDGYAFSKKIRENQITSHIPIIMLTARADEADKLEGLETGVDAYLTKPFSSRELRVRVKKLIELRKNLRERFSTATIVKPAEVSATSMDQEFLKKAIAFIESRLEDEALDANLLADEMALSISQLNRKLKALIDQPAGKLIRSMRLQRAADLLKQNAGTIADIAYRTGFSSQAHFTKSFQKQFGKSPKAYQQS